MKIRKGGKYLTRSNHVVVIDHIDKNGHYTGSIIGVKIGDESFDFRVNYAKDDGIFYVPEMESNLDIVMDISSEIAPVRKYFTDGTLEVVPNA
jgi:hypothetical protein